MFNQRKPKQFNYKSRFQKENETSRTSNLEEQWSNLKPKRKRKGGFLFSLPGLLVMLIALFILIYILEGYSK